MKQDEFYKLKNPSPKQTKELLRWTDDNGLKTDVTMLDVHKGMARIPSDRDFDTVVGLIDRGRLNSSGSSLGGI
ncbi:MAG: hypothetical protein ACE5J5_07755 [Candidatus Hydrothermarchaeales archaeon]